MGRLTSPAGWEGSAHQAKGFSCRGTLVPGTCMSFPKAARERAKPEPACVALLRQPFHGFSSDQAGAPDVMATFVTLKAVTHA